MTIYLISIIEYDVSLYFQIAQNSYIKYSTHWEREGGDAATDAAIITQQLLQKWSRRS